MIVFLQLRILLVTLFYNRFPPGEKAVSMIHKTFKKWNQCSRQVQIKIDEVYPSASATLWA